MALSVLPCPGGLPTSSGLQQLRRQGRQYTLLQQMMCKSIYRLRLHKASTRYRQWWHDACSLCSSGTFDSMAWRFLCAPPQQQASYVVRRHAGVLRISSSSLKCHRWLLAGDSRTAALPAAMESATCSKVKSMNRFACFTLSASCGGSDNRPLGMASVRRGLGPCLCPGVAISLALLSVEQSTAHTAASHLCIWMATALWTCRSERS